MSLPEASETASEVVRLETLGVEELNLLTLRLQEEIQQLKNLLSALTVALERFQDCSKAMVDLSKDPDEIQVPITSLVYLPGRIVDPKKVTINIGAGYYVEMPLEKANDYFDRKIKVVEEQIFKLQTIISGKNKQINQVYAYLDQKLTLVAQQRAAAAGGAGTA